MKIIKNKVNVKASLRQLNALELKQVSGAPKGGSNSGASCGTNGSSRC